MYADLEAPPPHRRITLPAGTLTYRVQRTLARADTSQINGLHLAPPTSMAGRFDLGSEEVAYLASSKRAALLESVFRRNRPHQTMEYISKRTLITVRTQRDLELLDLTGLEQQYPFLVAGRYGPSQGLSSRWRGMGFEGILYASAQHPGQACLALFEPAIHDCKVVKREPLVSKGLPLLAVLDAAHRAGITII